MTQKPYRDTTHLMVQGHEGWLEVNNTHYHAGAPVEVLFKWGHNMKVDGLCQKERLVAYAFDPEGTKRMLSINDRDEESYAISFMPEREGYYQVVVEQNGIVTLTVDGKHLLLPSLPKQSYQLAIIWETGFSPRALRWNWCRRSGKPGGPAIP